MVLLESPSLLPRGDCLFYGLVSDHSALLLLLMCDTQEQRIKRYHLSLNKLGLEMAGNIWCLSPLCGTK